MVKFENVEIKYGDFVAMENLNLDIEEGEFFHLPWPERMWKNHFFKSLGRFYYTVQR